MPKRGFPVLFCDVLLNERDRFVRNNDRITRQSINSATGFGNKDFGINLFIAWILHKNKIGLLRYVGSKNGMQPLRPFCFGPL